MQFAKSSIAIILLVFINMTAIGSAFAENKFSNLKVYEVSGDEIKFIVDYTYTGEFGTEQVAIVAAPLTAMGGPSRSIRTFSDVLRVGDNTVTFNMKKTGGSENVTTAKIMVAMTKLRRPFLTEEMPYIKVWTSSKVQRPVQTCSISGRVTGRRQATVVYTERKLPGGVTKTIVLTSMSLSDQHGVVNTARLDKNGRYVFTNVREGTYQLGPTEGFLTHPDFPTIECKAGETVRRDFVIRGPMPQE